VSSCCGPTTRTTRRGPSSTWTSTASTRRSRVSSTRRWRPNLLACVKKTSSSRPTTSQGRGQVTQRGTFRKRRSSMPGLFFRARRSRCTSTRSRTSVPIWSWSAGKISPTTGGSRPTSSSCCRTSSGRFSVPWRGSAWTRTLSTCRRWSRPGGRLERGDLVLRTSSVHRDR
jgi:hypothetical protein